MLSSLYIWHLEKYIPHYHLRIFMYNRFIMAMTYKKRICIKEYAQSNREINTNMKISKYLTKMKRKIAPFARHLKSINI